MVPPFGVVRVPFADRRGGTQSARPPHFPAAGPAGRKRLKAPLS